MSIPPRSSPAHLGRLRVVQAPVAADGEEDRERQPRRSGCGGVPAKWVPWFCAFQYHYLYQAKKQDAIWMYPLVN